MTATKRPVEGVVLSGGGAYAAYEVGVLQALVAGDSPATGRAAFDPGVVTGVSGGAVNAAILASWADPSVRDAVARLERVWLEDLAQQPNTSWNGVYRNKLDVREVLGPDATVTTPFSDAAALGRDFLTRTAHLFSRSSEPVTRRMLEFLDITAFVTAEPLARVLNAHVRPAAIQSSARKLTISATNFDSGQVTNFRNADMTDDRAVNAVLASAAIPGFFPPIQMGGVTFVDGAVLMNTPLQPAIVAGADVIHVIYLDPDVAAIENHRLNNLISTFERVLLVGRAGLVDRDMKMAARINQQLDHARKTGTDGGPALRSRSGAPLKRLTIHRYHPKEDLGGLSGILDMDQQHIRGLIEKGRADARAHDCDASECVL